MALSLFAPFGAAWASETCELPDGQRGEIDDKGVCIAEAPTFVTPLYFAGGGDDGGHATNVAIGQGSQTVTQRAVAIGQDAYANSQTPNGFTPGSTAVGAGARAEAWNTTALGSDAVAAHQRDAAVGRGASALGGNSVALGANSTAEFTGSVALGYASTTSVANTVSVGSDTLKRKIVNVAAADLSATSYDAVIGSQLFATNVNVTNNTTAITSLDDRVTINEGDITNLDSQVTQIDGRVTNIESDLNDGSIGLVRQDADTGAITVASASGGTSVDFTGTDGTRVLSGVANGVDDQDAATVAQLKASGLVDPNDGRALGAVVYDDMSLDRVTLGGIDGTVLANVANGLVAVGSREAINGGQLAEVRDDLQNRIGLVSDRVNTIEVGIADGSIGSGPVDDNGGQPIRNVGDGVADSDAATVGQMNRKYEQALMEANAYTDNRFDALQDDFNQRFEAVDSRIDRMAALSGAYAGMAMNTAGLQGRNRVGAGVGAQGGKRALAVGYQRMLGSRNNASISLGGAFSGSENSISAGAGFSW